MAFPSTTLNSKIRCSIKSRKPTPTPTVCLKTEQQNIINCLSALAVMAHPQLPKFFTR